MLQETRRLPTDRSVIIDRVIRSADGFSVKLVQSTSKEGYATIESGRYEVDGESIVCLSSQIGCVMRCKFCRSTDPFEFVPGKPVRMLRSLDSTEIADQAINAIETVPIPDNSKGIVFSYMGMGEPFANISAVEESIVALGNAYPASRATISTVGFNSNRVRGLADKVSGGEFPIPVKLHISLNGSSDEQRKQLMPYALPITQVVELAEEYADKTETTVKLNYVLVAGFNDSEEDVHRLAKLLADRQGVVLKLSDLNSDSTDLIVPRDRADQFERQLNSLGVPTCRFTSNGRDINAGCGELVKGKKDE
jgi:23S rRNA (adenine2503-C2)-methyltransferase